MEGGDDPPSEPLESVFPPRQGLPSGLVVSLVSQPTEAYDLQCIQGGSPTNGGSPPKGVAPMAPLIGGGVVLLVSLLVNLLVIIEYVACNLITLFLYSSME